MVNARNYLDDPHSMHFVTVCPESYFNIREEKV